LTLLLLADGGGKGLASAISTLCDRKNGFNLGDGIYRFAIHVTDQLLRAPILEERKTFGRPGIEPSKRDWPTFQFVLGLT
jgi:hypothetical protein